MQALKIQFTSSIDQEFYLLLSSNETMMAYATVIRHPGLHHVCAYLNVDRQRYYQQFDLFKSSNITYAGIGSTILSVPEKALVIFPVVFMDYWIGIDYKDAETQPSIDEALIALRSILDIYCLDSISHA